jgi:phosphoribosylglycinamide formyltransferase-1
MKKNLVIFASGAPDDGGTGALNLARHFPGQVIAFVSNHEHGGVKQRATEAGVQFIYFPGPYTKGAYHNLVERICKNQNLKECELRYALSGWFKKVYWLSPSRTFNVHPASLPRFGGEGMYGEKLHRIVWGAYEKGEISEGEIVMHFVTEKVDGGPVFFTHTFPLASIGNYAEYRATVRNLEHAFQPILTKLILEGSISWDGVHVESLKIPPAELRSC